MRQKYFQKLSRFILTLILPFNLMAQVVEELVNFDFVAYSLNKDLGEVSYLSDGEVHSFEVPARYRSKVQSYLGPPQLSFFRGGISTDGQLRDVLATIQIDPSIRKPLFLIAQNGDEYRVLQLEDSLESVPPGSVRFLNLTGVDLAMAFGERGQEQTTLPRLGVASYRIEARDVGNLRIRIAGYHDGEREMFMDSRVFPDERSRYLYFIWQPDSERPRVRLNVLKERVAPMVIPGSMAAAYQ